jgi:hypothetical protein
VQVYLIEVNTCPALGLHGAVLQDLLPRVMEEVVQKAIDPLFPPRPLPRACNSQGRTPQDSFMFGAHQTTEHGGESSSAAKVGSLLLPAPLSGFELLPLSLPPRRTLIERSMSSMAERSRRLQAMQGRISTSIGTTHSFVSLHATRQDKAVLNSSADVYMPIALVWATILWFYEKQAQKEQFLGHGR